MARRVLYHTVSSDTVDTFNALTADVLEDKLKRGWKVICVVPQHVNRYSRRSDNAVRWQATIFWEVEE